MEFFNSLLVGAAKSFSSEFFQPLNAALQRVSTIKPKQKRTNVKNAKSRGAGLKQIEGEIANLDAWQKQAAMEIPDGPQRIRGLAGSGKTIVLALKAAYLHARNPDWDIVVTFHTRALKQQFEKLITRFYFEDCRDEPNWERLRIMHSFGSMSEPGLYSEVCQAYGLAPKDYGYAKRTYGFDHAFQGICTELLDVIEKNPRDPHYDAILIDEAQDMPKEFLRIAYFCAEQRRIVWAYDDLQNLGAYAMGSLSTTFGTDEDGNDRVVLLSRERQPRADIILPRCYRNTPWALVTAHALGTGIYREEQPMPIVQHPDDPRLWEDIGYRTVSGELRLGKKVVLERAPDSTPEFFKTLIAPEDAVQFLRFQSDKEQLATVADMIATNVSKDELFPHDVLVVFPDALEAAQRGTLFLKYLQDRGVRGHIAGVTESRDIFQIDGSVTISGPFRAKGNEAPMVYLLDSQYCAAGFGLIKKRNTLFTSITRSRAWVRVCGFGPGMDTLQAEFNRVVQNGFQMKFKIPTASELTKIRTQHRDITSDEKREMSKIRSAFENLPEELREKVLKELSGRS